MTKFYTHPEMVLIAKSCNNVVPAALPVWEQGDGADVCLISNHQSPEVTCAAIKLLETRGMLTQRIDLESLRSIPESKRVVELETSLRSYRFMLYLIDKKQSINSADLWMLGLFSGLNPGKVAIWPVIPSYCQTFISPHPVLSIYPAIVASQVRDDGSRMQDLDEFLLSDNCFRCQF